MGFGSQTLRGLGELQSKAPINHKQPDIAGLTDLLSLYLQLLFFSNNCKKKTQHGKIIYLESVSTTVMYRLEMYQHSLHSAQQLMQKLKFHNGRWGERAAI